MAEKPDTAYLKLITFASFKNTCHFDYAKLIAGFLTNHNFILKPEMVSVHLKGVWHHSVVQPSSFVRCTDNRTYK